MAIDIPSRSALISQALAELQTAVDAVESDQTQPQPVGIDLDRSMVFVISAVLGGSLSGIYQRQQALSAQAAPINAEDDVLEGWAGSLDIQRRPASAARGIVSVSGAANGVVPAGQLYQRADNGVQYRVDTDIDLDAAGAGSGDVVATTPGARTNASAGTVLSIVSPATGIDSQATVGVDGLGGGADVERDDALLERVISKLSQPPAGGNDKDYRDWALKVPGIVDAWVFERARGNGTVDMAIADAQGTEDRLATQASVDAVQAYVDSVKVVDMPADGFQAYAPIREPLNYEIYIAPNTASVRAAVLAELDDLHAREAKPQGTLLLSHIRAAVSSAAGEVDNNVLSPTGDVQASARSILERGTVTFV